MTKNLSEFIQCSVATRISNEAEYNYRVTMWDCECGIEDALLVTASNEFEAKENAWIHIQQQKENQLSNEDDAGTHI